MATDIQEMSIENTENSDLNSEVSMSDGSYLESVTMNDASNYFNPPTDMSLTYTDFQMDSSLNQDSSSDSTM